MMIPSYSTTAPGTLVTRLAGRACDAILSYHLDGETCGVARFNQVLASHLGVPVLALDRHPHVTPLISVKVSELREAGDTRTLSALGDWYRVYDVFCHDSPSRCDDGLLRQARRLYAGNVVIARDIRDLFGREDVRVAFCPSTLTGRADRGAYRVLAFGMAHKQHVEHFSQLKHRLDLEHSDYTVEVSRAVHVGTTPPGLEELRAIFGDRLRDLGCLGDDGLARVLAEVDAVACYYTPALRANHTRAWAALAAGKTLYTNTDADSPPLDAAAHSWARLVEIVRA